MTTNSLALGFVDISNNQSSGDANEIHNQFCL